MADQQRHHHHRRRAHHHLHLDPAGELTQLTLPDSSYLSYDYDHAHRLTNISDADNNEIEYTLDALGDQDPNRHL